MRRTFDLTFPTERGDFRISINITKSFGERLSCKTGYRGQPVKWIKCTTKDPELEKITSCKEIDHIVQASELESLYPTEDERGNPDYVVIDKSMLKNMFPSTPEMKVLRTVPSSCVPLHYMSGTHYFVDVKKSKKGKVQVANPEDVAMYDMVHNGLTENNEVLLVRYTAMNTNKYAIIFPDQCGLRMSNLIASNYQKERHETQLLGQNDKPRLYERLVEETRHKRLKVENFKDDYGEKLQEIVDATLNGKDIKCKNETKVTAFARLADFDEPSRKKKKSK